MIYVLAGLLAFFSWFNLSEPLRRSAVWLIGLAFHPHCRPGFPHGAGRAAAGDQSLLLGHLHWLGRVRARLGAGTVSPERHRRVVVASGIGFVTLIIAHHLAFERRHDGNDAGRAGHEFLAGDARGRRDAGIRQHVRRRVPGD